MEIVWTILLVISVFFFWLIGLLGLPGNWLMLVATGIYSLLVPTDETASVWWIAMGLLLVLAIVGEAVEMLASAHGVRKHGGSKRGPAVDPSVAAACELYEQHMAEAQGSETLYLTHAPSY